MNKLLISACLLGIPCRYDAKSVPLPADQIARLTEHFDLIPVCPETLGGLPTPRIPSERSGDRVINRNGTDVTEQYRRGAEATAEICRICGAKLALLKERSPSCGSGKIYDGSHTGTLTDGDGATAQRLKKDGVRIFGESELDGLIEIFGQK